MVLKRHRGPLKGDISKDEDHKVKDTSKEVLKVVYGGRKIKSNEFVSVEDAKNQPHVRWRGEPQPGKKYTLVMVDPDAPSPSKPIYKEWRHWVAVNIPGKNPKEGIQLWPYSSPNPPKGSGEHRYWIKWYEQTNDISPTYKFENANFAGNWSSDDFASKNGLILKGYIVFKSSQN